MIRVKSAPGTVLGWGGVASAYVISFLTQATSPPVKTTQQASSGLSTHPWYLIIADPRILSWGTESETDCE